MSVARSSTDPAGVPVVDIAGWDEGGDAAGEVVAAVAAACERIGFVVIRGHGVPAPVIERTYAMSAEFFGRPVEEKLACTLEGWDEYIGFSGVGRTSYRGGGPPNLVEQFHVNRFENGAEAWAAGLSPAAAASQAPNVWPTRPAGFRTAWRAYYAEMEQLSARLAGIFACGLGMAPEGFEPLLRNHVSNLSANWYPPQLDEPLPGQLRSRTHVDFSFFTILYQDDAPGGLEVRDRDGVWRPIPAIPGTYVVNLGDVMNRVSNDRWRATFHHVVNPPPSQRHRGRISIPYFVTVDYDATIECAPTCVDVDRPAAYPPVTAGAYAAERRSGRRSVTTV